MLGLKEKQWYHAVGVYDKGDIRLYVNGEEKGRTKYSLGAARPSVMNYDMEKSDSWLSPNDSGSGGPPAPRGAGPYPSKKPPYVVTPCRGAPYVYYGTGPTPASTALIGCVGNCVGVFESRGFNGIIDELMFFDRALSGDEVKQIYELQR